MFFFFTEAQKPTDFTLKRKDQRVSMKTPQHSLVFLNAIIVKSLDKKHYHHKGVLAMAFPIFFLIFLQQFLMFFKQAKMQHILKMFLPIISRLPPLRYPCIIFFDKDFNSF